MHAIRPQEERISKTEAVAGVQELLVTPMPVEVSKFTQSSSFPMNFDSHTWFKLPTLDSKGDWRKKLFKPYFKLVEESESKVLWEYQQGDSHLQIEFDVGSQTFHYTSTF